MTLSRFVRITGAVLATIIAGMLIPECDMPGTLTILVVVGFLWYLALKGGE